MSHRLSEAKRVLRLRVQSDGHVFHVSAARRSNKSDCYVLNWGRLELTDLAPVLQYNGGPSAELLAIILRDVTAQFLCNNTVILPPSLTVVSYGLIVFHQFIHSRSKH